MRAQYSSSTRTYAPSLHLAPSPFLAINYCSTKCSERVITSPCLEKDAIMYVKKSMPGEGRYYVRKTSTYIHTYSSSPVFVYRENSVDVDVDMQQGGPRKLTDNYRRQKRHVAQPVRQGQIGGPYYCLIHRRRRGSGARRQGKQD